jgi:hypothetical protein
LPFAVTIRCMKTMNHDEAVRLKASEKYLLGELSAELRDQYEDHYFDCAECARDVRAGAAFIDNARDHWQKEPASSAASPDARRTHGWLVALLRPAIAVPALALLLLVAAYQNAVTIPHLRTALSRSQDAQTLPALSLIAQDSRGGGAARIEVPAGKAFSLFFDIPPQSQFKSYACEIQSASGTPELSLSVSAEEAKRTVQLLIPAGRLEPGDHVLVVRGSGSPENADAGKIGSARYPFSLKYTQ